jgi:3-methyladenine DNA glycosylase AlkD
VRGFLESYLASDQEFELRFASVMLMKAFITDESIDGTLQALAQIRHDGYYAKMAVAWAIAECCVGYRDKTFELLRSGRLDDFTQNKTIRKIKESYRVSPEDKLLASSLKRGRSKAGRKDES